VFKARPIFSSARIGSAGTGHLMVIAGSLEVGSGQISAGDTCGLVVGTLCARWAWHEFRLTCLTVASDQIRRNAPV
jgi:hypothetical protein